MPKTTCRMEQQDNDIRHEPEDVDVPSESASRAAWHLQASYLPHLHMQVRSDPPPSTPRYLHHIQGTDRVHM